VTERQLRHEALVPERSVPRHRPPGFTAPAGHGMRWVMARGFGHIYDWKKRGLWVVDVRPFGRIYEIPVGDSGLRLDRPELADAVLESILCLLKTSSVREIIDDFRPADVACRA